MAAKLCVLSDERFGGDYASTELRVESAEGVSRVARRSPSAGALATARSETLRCRWPIPERARGHTRAAPAAPAGAARAEAQG